MRARNLSKTAVEADQGQRLAESLVKQATGGDVMTARFMRAEYFDFVPAFKLFLATNHKPIIRGTDLAMWRRVRLVPFTGTIPPEEQDRQLETKLRQEWPGILRWAVEGCLAWQRDGLGEPEEVRSATAAYRAEMDLLGDFIRDRCVVDPGAEATAKALYAGYTEWCQGSGERPVTKKAFGLRLQERGITQAGTEDARGWEGIRLRGAPDAFEPLTRSDAFSSIDSHDARAVGLTGKTRQDASGPPNASAVDAPPTWEEA